MISTARIVLLAAFCCCTARAAAFSPEPYFPLPTGATWTYAVSGGGTEVRTVVGAIIFNGSSVSVIRDQTGSESYFTNDAAGIRYHGGFFFDPLEGNETDTFVPPLVVAAPEASIGVPVNGSGTVYANFAGSILPVAYSYVSTPLGIEPVVVPAGSFANALHNRVTLNYPAYGYTETIDTWLVPGIGTVKETNHDTVTGQTATWELTSHSVPDIVPDAFAFAPRTVDASFVAVASEPITITGIMAATPIRITGGQYQINGGPFVMGEGSVINGNQVTVRVISPLPGFSASATLNIGGVTAVFTVTTSSDTAPDTFAFAPVTGAPLGTTLNSNRITVTGINTSTPISIAGGEYSVAGQPYTSAPGTVPFNFASVEVRVASSASHGVTTKATLTIGGASADFSVTTLVPGQGSSSALFYASPLGDHIGEGRTRMVNLGAGHPGTLLEVTRHPTGGIQIYASEPGGWYYLDVDAPGGGALGPGRYEGAVRYPFNGTGSGLSFSATGRGCNVLTGRFDVLEVAYAADGAVQRLAVNFEQRCEGLMPPLLGQIRVNSTVPLGSNAIRRAHADVSGEGRSDVLWRNSASGENYLFLMNGLSIANEGYLRTVPVPDWQIAATGDFDGDGRADVLWRNAGTGETYVYFMDGLSIVDEGYLRTVPAPWQIAGAGDFDGDGRADILWRNSGTGETYVFLMDGLSIVNEGYLRTVPAAWQVAGTGDLDGDGRADVLWRNGASGENYLFFMNGVSIANEGYVRAVPVPDWQIVGTGDFDGDGMADIVWRNANTGESYVFLMNANNIAGEGYLRTVADNAWQIVAVGDYDGDGKSDLLWRNASSGLNYMFPMDGIAIKPTEGYLRSVSPGGWGIVAR